MNDALRLAGLWAALPLAAAAADPLEAWTDDGGARAEYRAPDAAALRAAERQFAAELAGRAGEWKALGLQREAAAEGPALREPAGERRGLGVYGFAARPRRDWLIQAPHSRDDLHTGRLARLAYAESGARAAMWNSVRRHTPIAGASGEADMAHLDDSYWQALTRAFATAYPQGRVIQWHGFDGDKRKSAAAQDLDLIVSAGQATPPPWVRTAAACLKTGLGPFRAGLYPDDVAELGGTTNAQGRLLRGLGHSGFIHLEMSLPLRETLVRDGELRRRLLDCLGRPAG